jgi:hypothetical protein
MQLKEIIDVLLGIQGMLVIKIQNRNYQISIG